MWGNAKRRARRKRLPFNIEPGDIKIPARCPVLKIPLVKCKRRSGDCSPTLDRVIPEKGYVKGNVIVVSKLANQIKSSATVPQLYAVAMFYARLINGNNHAAA